MSEEISLTPLPLPPIQVDCTVNSKGDLYCLGEARPFIDEECTFVKKTKAGLMMVALKSNPKMVISVPKKNVDFAPEEILNE